ncbi:MAG: prepilin-type N-terminal cleavage/methylation domain-containing protein [Thermoguttaceae bacterium]|nr:prepilin-type N-terminal cleavage/methylation domain-containing protein [Thermoguttaceae bacterium]
MKHSGFTLIELLIVLAIIVMVIGIGTPSVTRILDRSKFRDGVLALQSELGHTRSEAMKTGSPLAFRYRCGTGEYQIYPRQPSSETDPPPQAVPVRLLPESTLFMGGAAIESESFLLPSRNGDRPHDGEPVGSLTSPAVQEENAKPLAPNQSSPVPTPSTSLVPTVSGWSKPILFFPNGRTSTAVIFLRSRPEPDKQDYYSEISYRGITGSARVSSISVYPPGSPEFPSVLSPQAFSRLNAEAPSSSAERNLFR